MRKKSWNVLFVWQQLRLVGKHTKVWFFFFSENDVGPKYFVWKNAIQIAISEGNVGLYSIFSYRVPLLSLNNPQKDF